MASYLSTCFTTCSFNRFGTEFLKINVHSQPELILQLVDKFFLAAGSCRNLYMGRSVIMLQSMIRPLENIYQCAKWHDLALKD